MKQSTLKITLVFLIAGWMWGWSNNLWSQQQATKPALFRVLVGDVDGKPVSDVKIFVNKQLLQRFDRKSGITYDRTDENGKLLAYVSYSSRANLQFSAALSGYEPVAAPLIDELSSERVNVYFVLRKIASVSDDSGRGAPPDTGSLRQRPDSTSVNLRQMATQSKGALLAAPQSYYLFGGLSLIIVLLLALLGFSWREQRRHDLVAAALENVASELHAWREQGLTSAPTIASSGDPMQGYTQELAQVTTQLIEVKELAEAQTKAQEEIALGIKNDLLGFFKSQRNDVQNLLDELRGEEKLATGLEKWTHDFNFLQSKFANLPKALQSSALPFHTEPVRVDTAAADPLNPEATLQQLKAAIKENRDRLGKLKNFGKEAAAMTRRFLLQELLPAMDDLERIARTNQGDYFSIRDKVLKPDIQPKLQTLQEKVLGLEQSAKRYLDRIGVAPITIRFNKDKLDMKRHQCTETEKNPDLPDGTIVRLRRHGYLYNGELLRHAEVVAVKNS